MVARNVEAAEGDELMLAVQIELDRAVTKEVCDAVYETASLTPQEKTPQKLESEAQTRKDVIMNVIANSVGLERLYFIVRSSVMGGITGIFTFTIISLFRVTGFIDLVLIGIAGFVLSLAFSRLMDKSLVWISNLAILYLKRHKRISELILKNF
jgi:hypothetical protein